MVIIIHLDLASILTANRIPSYSYYLKSKGRS